MSQVIKIGTRGSDLALWQANHVSDILKSLGHSVEIVIIKTKGDRITDLSFDKIEGKGFFTSEIEEQLLNSNVDLAVHSYKDLETDQPEGLKVAATLNRAAVEDLLLVRKDRVQLNRPLGLGSSSVVGTSSIRRKTQLLALDEGLKVKDLRGNVPTRIAKLRSGEYDAIVLARAGVERLQVDVEDLQTLVLDRKEFVPAPAQGALALQIRSTDTHLGSILSEINDETTAACVGFERELLQKMDGGCHTPLGANCIKNEREYSMDVFYAESMEGPVGFYSVEGDAIQMRERISKLVDSLKS